MNLFLFTIFYPTWLFVQTVGRFETTCDSFLFLIQTEDEKKIREKKKTIFSN